MPKYEVTVMLHVPMISHIEADDEDQAWEKAQMMGVVDFENDYTDYDAAEVDYIDDIVEIS